MTLLRFLSLAPYRVMLVIAVTGVISGLCSAALLAVINRALYHSSASGSALLLAMVILISGKILSAVTSRWLLIKYAQQTLLELSIRLCREVLAAPLRLIEETGAHRVLAALTTDVPVLGSTLQALPTLTVNVAVIIGCAGYLIWLYPLGLLALLLAVGIGVAIYAGLHSSAFGAIFGARQRRDDLMNSYRELTGGLKELKMNRARREEFLIRNLEETAQHLKEQNLLAVKKYLYLDAWSQALFYLMLVGVLFFFPRNQSNSTEILTGFAFAALYMMNPVWSIMGTIPTLTSGAASLKKLDELGLALKTSVETQAASQPTRGASSNVEKIELDNVAFSYKQGADEFNLGPIDLTLHRGEVVFLVGGNGSGKTTLVKLIAGLYQPDSGEVRVDGLPVTLDKLDSYRQLFSVVFFDFHLFDRLLGAFQADVDAIANGYLDQLELNHKVTVAGGRFSTTDLSQGQRKRLALLTALIEERPICIFDEWAADQDPHYKQIFYTRILPMLKAHRKTVVVVTHDDRFFDHGDRVIKLEDGRITSPNRLVTATA